jgi:hypothetical protein
MERRRVPHVPVPRHHHPYPRQGRQPRQPRPVFPEGVCRRQIQQRYLDVGAHVPRHEHTGRRQEHRAVPRRVRVVGDHSCLRPGPRHQVTGVRNQRPERRRIVPGRRRLPFPGKPGALPRGDDDRGRRRVPRHVRPEFRAPQQVVPVWVRRPPGHRPQPPRRQKRGDPGQVGDRHRRVDQQALTGFPHDHRGRRRVHPRRAHEHARRDLSGLAHARSQPRFAPTPHSAGPDCIPGGTSCKPAKNRATSSAVKPPGVTASGSRPASPAPAVITT